MSGFSSESGESMRWEVSGACQNQALCQQHKRGRHDRRKARLGLDYFGRRHITCGAEPGILFQVQMSGEDYTVEIPIYGDAK